MHGPNAADLEIPALREMKPPSASPTVWSEFSALAAETGAPVNLGQVGVFLVVWCDAQTDEWEFDAICHVFSPRAVFLVFFRDVRW